MITLDDITPLFKSISEEDINFGVDLIRNNSLLDEFELAIHLEIIKEDLWNTSIPAGGDLEFKAWCHLLHIISKIRAEAGAALWRTWKNKTY